MKCGASIAPDISIWLNQFLVPRGPLSRPGISSGGAKPNRIFFTNELPRLRLLEEKGYVKVYFAKSPETDWTNPGDWIHGTAKASIESGELPDYTPSKTPDPSPCRDEYRV